jgi:alpha-glucosidase (family GH31 glycosyl hydrolase)
MKFIGFYITVILVWLPGTNNAQQMKDKIEIPVPKNVAWWMGVINQGEMMPLKNGYQANLKSNYGNQVQPLLLSSSGELIWSEQPFEVRMDNDILIVQSPEHSLIHEKAGTTLKDVFLYASKNYFPPAGKIPDELLFSAPQYNTWIELMYDQNQKDILAYARQILDNGFPPGVLMIDDNWQEDYGKWDFHPGRFPDPKSMMDSLHHMGFKVMLWVVPMVSPDCDVYRYLQKRQMLLKDNTGRPAIVRWWNGASALLDLSNPETSMWFKNQLDYLQEKYNVDGFKFDAGDFNHYENCYSTDGRVSPQHHCELYARIGLDYPLNEYRAMWKMAGQPLVNRLRDKAHNWEDLQKLVPHLLLQGLMGYNFTCPDLIGGGEYTSFLPGSEINQELIVRSAQCHALMPMMQFSVAPWRILDKQHLDACKQAVELRKKFTPLILELTRRSAHSGEPVVRSMDYVFPGQGYEKITDQFLLGDHIIVAPVVEEGLTKRKVVLPKGNWRDGQGKKYRGGRVVEVDVSLESLPYFINEKSGFVI